MSKAGDNPVGELRSILPFLIVVSLLINILMLASPLYMLQVFDRVLTSHSIETLIFLSLLVLAALLVMGALDACRVTVFARFGDWLDRRISGKVLDAVINSAARPASRSTIQPLADIATVRQFLGSPSAGAIFDTPMVPIFVAAIWFLHPILGAVAAGSAALLAALAMANDFLSRGPGSSVSLSGAESQAFLETTVANADVVRTMGLQQRVVVNWAGMRDALSTQMLSVSTIVGVLGAVSKSIRLAVQAAILGAGAYLVIVRAITPGEMIAASILLGRALAPVETALSGWRQLVSARHAWKRLRALLESYRPADRSHALVDARGDLEIENVALRAAADRKPILQNVSFALEPGDTLGVIGDSAAGKSSLGRVLVGAWPPSAGSVRFDGAELAQWDPEALGNHVGYVPQSAALFPGTVRQNIARFRDVPFEAVMEAGRRAGCHEAILQLPDAYDTDVGHHGERLSGGQRQRVALARAVFGKPRLVVLDEPDANLDQAGHEALLRCLASLQSEDVTLVVIAHRRDLLSVCGKLLWLENGRVRAFGPTKDVIEFMGDHKKKHLRAVDGEAKQQWN
ncbi:type I secretion system permease/ATPase [Nitratireductor sp. StC3]|uniref:type I secretion system permease/ATPase n=1 Tax=Nitratireductor sp. StC3 TaxID=2126741 RepID=UPI001304DEE9|nr:type I secretion system permease/ATPase [Nitratireductor sp. StC3]